MSKITERFSSKQKHLIFVKGITSLTQEGITSENHYSLQDVSDFVLIETISQLASYHVKYLNKFNCFSFLATIKNYTHFDLSRNISEELIRFSVSKMTFNNNTYSYTGNVLLQKKLIATCDPIIVKRDFDSFFKKDILQKYYFSNPFFKSGHVDFV